MVKIDIISGFLGAGKTTLIRKLIQQGFQGEKVVLIENEFGEIGIDGGFLQEVGVEIREMNSGCICCSLVGDFEESLKEVITTYTPERIIIEPSGVGKLSDVIKAVESVTSQGEVELNNKITVVNAAKCNMYMKNFGEFFLNQVEHADSIVLSRTGGMTDGMLDEVVDQLRVHNHHGTMITTPWEQLDGADMLASMEHQHTLEESMRAELHHDHEHGEHCGCGGHEHDHHHEHGEH
ncbi:MAG: GTP-binding protein, partial [Eubacteriales bacterium]